MIMTWFVSKKKRERMEIIQDFVPTSKIQLKRFCQQYCNSDIKKAQELYEYYAKDINLPDFDPVPATWQQQLKDNANGFIDWINQNQNMLTQGYEFFRQIISNKGKLPAITSVEENVAAEPLTSIN